MLNVQPFRQRTSRCGPASLKMILNYFGVDKTEEELSRLAECTENAGTTAQNLAKAVASFGFKTEIKDFAEIADIKKYVEEKKIPVIIDWFFEDDGHYSVVVGVDNENIYLQDPSFGHRRALRLDTFYRCWFDFEGDYIKSKNDMIIRRLMVIYPK